MKKFIVAIDQGTTSTRSILFDLKGNPLFISQKEFKQFFPNNGWVEHDPDEIWSTTLKTLKEVILRAKQIKGKICGYAGQDREKKLFHEELFVNLQDVLQLFKTSEMICYYCKEKTLLMYTYVREPKQWTLERMNNSFGHNRDNVVISCLSCNIRRRTMASERYVLTKELGKIVKLDHD